MLSGVEAAVVELAIPNEVPYDGHLRPLDLEDLATRFPDVKFFPTHLYFAPGEINEIEALATLRTFENVTFPQDGDVFQL